MTSDFSSWLAATLADPLRLFDGAHGAIGVVGVDVPIDVLLASGRPFGHLPWFKGRATPLADRWLESSFPGWARSILEDWLLGKFDHFDTVIFSRGDDAAQRLYYYLCELQRRGLARGPRLEIFDVAKIQRPASVKHCELAIRNLMRVLDVDARALTGGIELANQQRMHYQQLDAARVAAGHWYENIARASVLVPRWPLVQGFALPALPTARRVLLAGSVPPDDTLHRAVESTGWNVVGEVHQLSLTRLGPPVYVGSDSAAAVLAQHCNTAAGSSRDFTDRAATLVQCAVQKQAEAVVLWLTDEDEVLAWHVARQRAALAAAGLPVLVLTRRRWDCADGAGDQICRFLQELAV